MRKHLLSALAVAVVMAVGIAPAAAITWGTLDTADEYPAVGSIMVDWRTLGAPEFERILIEPENSLIRQYTELLATENLELRFSDQAVRTIASMAAEINESAENIGARRLHTVLEHLLEELSFEAPERAGEMVEVSEEMVSKRLGDVVSAPGRFIHRPVRPTSSASRASSRKGSDSSKPPSRSR